MAQNLNQNGDYRRYHNHRQSFFRRSNVLVDIRIRLKEAKGLPESQIGNDIESKELGFAAKVDSFLFCGVVFQEGDEGENILVNLRLKILNFSASILEMREPACQQSGASRNNHTVFEMEQLRRSVAKLRTPAAILDRSLKCSSSSRHDRMLLLAGSKRIPSYQSERRYSVLTPRICFMKSGSDVIRSLGPTRAMEPIGRRCQLACALKQNSVLARGND